MKISEAILAESNELPPMGEVMYEYVVAGNGLFIRAEDSRIEACVMIAPARCHGLAEITEYANLKIERVSDRWLWSVLGSARKRMPNEAMYQFMFGEMRTWRCMAPKQTASPTAVDFVDEGASVIDLHSHNSMPAFFSETDDGDEGGLRFYVVIGRIDTDTPEIRVRMGVYGHFMGVPADGVFDGLGPFVDQYSVISNQSSEDGDDYAGVDALDEERRDRFADRAAWREMAGA